MFVIHQYTDDLNVFYEGKPYLHVLRKFNWLGRFTSTFIMNDIEILKTTYDSYFFKKYFSIVFQFLPEKIKLIKKGKCYFLEKGNLSFSLHSQRFYKNPLWTIQINNTVIGNVSTDLTLISPHPMVYNLVLDFNKTEELYCLLTFLIQLPPTYS